MKPAVTLDSVKAAAGHTWFSIHDEGESIDLDTRDHGSVYHETAGQNDIDEANRLVKLLRKTFAQSTFQITSSVCDEWVSISIRKEPLSKKEQDVLRQKSVRAKLGKRIKELSEQLKSKEHGDLYLHFDNGYTCEGGAFRKPSLEIVVRFGERLLYTNRGQFLYKTAEQAEAAARAVMPLLTGIPLLEWVRKPIAPLYEKTTFNYRPPNNIIERSSEVVFRALLDVK